MSDKLSQKKNTVTLPPLPPPYSRFWQQKNILFFLRKNMKIIFFFLAKLATTHKANFCWLAKNGYKLPSPSPLPPQRSQEVTLRHRKVDFINLLLQKTQFFKKGIFANFVYVF